MSVSTVVKCDGPDCNQQRYYPPQFLPQEWHLPDNWFTMVRGDTQLHEAWHFCSPSCLHTWLKRDGFCSLQQGTSNGASAMIEVLHDGKLYKGIVPIIGEE